VALCSSWRTFAGLVLACCLPALTVAQQTRPQSMEPFFQTNPTSAQDLAEQTRRFPVVDREAMMFASIGVLQDMGFKVSGGEQRFGLLLGEKTADVPGAGLTHAIGEAALITVTVLLSVAVGENLVMDLPEQVEQRIYVSLLVSDEPDSELTSVRISLDRDMIYDHGGFIPDHTELPLVYQEFFERLSKALYLEGEQW
jgi:hypothetical protein